MKSKFFITIFILFALILLAFAGWFYALSKISSERKAILELRKTILRGEKNNINEKSLSRLVDSVKKEREIVESVFLKENDLIRLIKGLESIGESSGVSLKISAISSERSAASKPNVSFVAKGTFEQLFQYLYFLENLPYMITINKVSFQNEEDEKESVQGNDKKIGLIPKWQALFSIQLESYEN